MIRVRLVLCSLAIVAAPAGCVTYEGDCAEEPDSRFCDPWICCVEPSTEGCDPAEVAARCGPDGGADGGLDDGGDSDAGPCGGCGGDTPVCDESAGECVECTETDASACEGDTPLCDPDLNACVACLEHADCTEPEAPACLDGACGPCTADEQCEGRADTPVCDEEGGRCVECTADTEAERCGDFSCSRLSLTCTETDRGTLDVCDPCEADSECATGRRCVLHSFEGTDVGHFCFLDSAMGGCGDTDMTRRPYRTRTELDSIDGVTATYCMPPVTTTCQGIRDTQSETCALDTDCGEDGLDDGYCPLIGPGMGLCSYLCGGAVDCANPLSCGGTPQHCRPS